MITYSLRGEAVARQGGAALSNEAALTAEICERLLELDELKKDRAAGLVRRLAAIADLTPSAFMAVLHVGCGQVDKVAASYEEQVRNRGKTRQSLHWQWGQDQQTLMRCFPAMADTLQAIRDSIEHHEDAMSAADALRRGRDSAGGGDHD